MMVVRAGPQLVQFALAISLVLVVPVGPTAALPDVHPVANTVHVGEFGVEAEDAFASAEGGLLVSPGSRVTVQAAYRFEDDALEAGVTHSFQGAIRVNGANGPVDAQSVFASVQGPGTVDESGTLQVEFVVPEVVRDLSVTLDAKRFRSNTGSGGGLVSEASSTAPLTLVAVFEPVAFVSGGLVVGQELEAGEVDFTGTEQRAEAYEGHTFVSTDLGARFALPARIERPLVTDVSDLMFHATVTLGVHVEGGPSYGNTRQVYQESCSDWMNHQCSMASDTRAVDVEVVLPASALEPGRVVDVSVNVVYELWWWDAQAGQGDGAFVIEHDSGRHLVLGA